MEKELQNTIQEVLNETNLKTLLEQNTKDGLAVDIQDVDELLNNGSISTYLGNSSLQAELFPTLPLRGPGGYFLNVRRKDDQDNKLFELIRGSVQTYESEPEKTGITKEALEDLIAQHGQDNQTKVLNALFEGIINDAVNEKVYEFLEDNSYTVDDLEVEDCERYVQLIIRRVSELLHTQSEGLFRGCSQYCLVPSKIQASFEILGFFGKVDVQGCTGNVICESNKIRIIHNPDPDAEYVYVGLRSDIEPNRSQAQYSPFRSDIRQAVDYETGNINYHIFNRFALTMNPVQDRSDEKKALMWKFKVQDI